MTTKSYTVLGWIAWQIITRVAKRKIGQNKLQLGAAGVVAAVVVGGAIAAKSAGGSDDDS